MAGTALQVTAASNRINVNCVCLAIYCFHDFEMRKMNANCQSAGKGGVLRIGARSETEMLKCPYCGFARLTGVDYDL